MIVHCPGCQSRYEVAPRVAESKKHYKLHCNMCGTYWRVSSETLVEQKVQNEPFSPSSPLHYRKKKHSSPKTYSTWNDFIRQYSLDWIILLGGIGIAILLMVYEGEFLPDFAQLTSVFSASKTQEKEILPTLLPTTAFSLSIENVDFTTIEKNGHLRLIVKGEIVNAASQTNILPDLKILAWGRCSSDSTNLKDQESLKTSQSSKRCLLMQWIHPMDEEPLGAGQKKFFEAVAPNGGANVNEIEVTWSS